MFKVRISFVVHSTTCRRPTIEGSRSTSIPLWRATNLCGQLFLVTNISTSRWWAVRFFCLAPHLSAVQWDVFDHFLHMNSIPRAKTVFFMPSLTWTPGIWRFPWWRSWSWRYNLHFCQVGSGREKNSVTSFGKHRNKRCRIVLGHFIATSAEVTPKCGLEMESPLKLPFIQVLGMIVNWPDSFSGRFHPSTNSRWDFFPHVSHHRPETSRGLLQLPPQNWPHRLKEREMLRSIIASFPVEWRGPP